MTRTVLASLAFVLATPALADDAPAERNFTRDGATYVYTRDVQGNAIVLRGRNTATGAAFALTIRNGKVDGQYNGAPVSFDVPAKAPAPDLFAAR